MLGSRGAWLKGVAVGSREELPYFQAVTYNNVVQFHSTSCSHCAAYRDTIASIASSGSRKAGHNVGYQVLSVRRQDA